MLANKPISQPFVAFCVSLGLSLWAIWLDPVVNRDGTLYLESAQLYVEGGAAALKGVFDWAFLPILIAEISGFLSVNLEMAAYLYSIFFLAATAAVAVLLTQKIAPSTGWYAVLTISALPAMNSYREAIIREQGFWFFTLLACLLIVCAKDRRHLFLLLSMIALLGAAAFRIEALVFGPIFLFWYFRQSAGQTTKAFFRHQPMVVAIFSVALLAAGSVLLLSAFGSDRVAFYISWFDWSAKLLQLEELSSHLRQKLPEFSQKDATEIIVWGLPSLLLTRLLDGLDLFLLPLALSLHRKSLRLEGAMKLPLMLAGAYTVVLLTFLFLMLFLTDRYVALLFLLMVPLLSLSVQDFAEKAGRLKPFVLGVLVVMPLVQIGLPLNSGKTEIKEAARYLKSLGLDSSQICTSDSRLGFYVSSSYKSSEITVCELRTKEGLDQFKAHKAVALYIDPKDLAASQWVQDHRRVVAAEFSGHRNFRVVILKL
jgi:hypothetical protein